MYILDIDQNLIWLPEKDIKLIQNAAYDTYEARVLAIGPVAAFWEHEGLNIRSQDILFQGTLTQCQAFMKWLTAYLPGFFINRPYFESTARTLANTDEPDHSIPQDEDDPIRY